KPVEDFYCVPPAPGSHPAVILLHGAVPRGFGNQLFATRCRKLATAGYYAMFVEYYSQAGPARPGDRPVTGKGFAAWVNGNFPTWTREIADGINVLGQNPAVQRDRIALIGHSLGAFLALAVGASEGGEDAAHADPARERRHHCSGALRVCTRRAAHQIQSSPRDENLSRRGARARS